MKAIKPSVTRTLWALAGAALFGALIWFLCVPAVVGSMVEVLIPGLAVGTLLYAVCLAGTAAVGAVCTCFAVKKKWWSGAAFAAAATAATAPLTGGDLTAVLFVLAGGLAGAGTIAAYGFLEKKMPAVCNRETISYIVFGVLTTAVSFVSQMMFASLGTLATVNTIGSWVCAVIFAYIVNKLFVFESHTDTKKAFFRELWLFFAARLASLGMELVFMAVTVDILGFSEAVCKLIAQVFILIANYIFSKLIIFRKKEE